MATYVTKPVLPPKKDLIAAIGRLYDTYQLSNSGPIHEEFEMHLCEFLNVEHLVLFGNATVALSTALRSLDKSGSVITSPFSFVSTAHSIVWSGNRPIFCDIDPVTKMIAATCVERLVTPDTAAIVPVHIYGNCCDIAGFEELSESKKVPVIYDAAHVFGVNDNGGSILRHGSMSVVSFHATKVFNTLEGGAVICSTYEQKVKVQQLCNFGLAGDHLSHQVGFNGKMNEVEALFGLHNLLTIKDDIEKRKRIFKRYQINLESVDQVNLYQPSDDLDVNGAYVPIFINESHQNLRDKIFDHLQRHNIFTKKYFYPIIPDYSVYQPLSKPKNHFVNASMAAETVLCLPIYPTLELRVVDKICDLIKSACSC